MFNNKSASYDPVRKANVVLAGCILVMVAVVIYGMFIDSKEEPEYNKEDFSEYDKEDF